MGTINFKMPVLLELILSQQWSGCHRTDLAITRFKLSDQIVGSIVKILKLDICSIV